MEKSGLIPHENMVGKIIAYDGPKALIISFAIYLLLIMILPRFAPRWINRRQAAYVFISDGFNFGYFDSVTCSDQYGHSA
jgi:hypothetical protein